MWCIRVFRAGRMVVRVLSVFCALVVVSYCFAFLVDIFVYAYGLCRVWLQFIAVFNVKDLFYEGQ